MPATRTTRSNPVPLSVTREAAAERVRELGGIRAVAHRLGLPERVAHDLLTSERVLPEWVLDALFEGWREYRPRQPSD